MNHIVIMGRLTRDPELRETQSGKSVASFSLAVNRRFTQKDSNERQTDFFDVVAWEQKAQFVSRYFTKGQMAAVEGRLEFRDWTDKEGNKRRSAEVIADNIYFTGSKAESGGSGGGGNYGADIGAGNMTPVESSDFEELDVDDGELPF